MTTLFSLAIRQAILCCCHYCWESTRDLYRSPPRPLLAQNITHLIISAYVAFSSYSPALAALSSSPACIGLLD
ncbi:hypothetical protein HBI16_158190 [Parastagonospora nodorum]|nr:hypothetical protein HBI16_158190 [Parastagonospora nodorum]